MLSYSWVAAFLSNFEYWRLFSLIESGTNPNLTKIKTLVEGAVLSMKKCMTRKDLSIVLFLMNLMQNIPVSGRFFNKK